MLLELNNIKKKFKTPSRNEEKTVLDGISLSVAQGESLALIGPSGSGKSTLLNIIGTLDQPTSGSVIFAGEKLSELSDMEIARFRNREIGFIFQLHHLFPQCTVLENVLFPTIALGREKQPGNPAQRAMELLEDVGLGQHTDYFPAQLSGGELQRVAVVRALINQPRLILADEPTGSLDAEASNKLGQLLVKLNQENRVTLIVVSHSLEIARLMDKKYRLKNGRLQELESLNKDR